MQKKYKHSLLLLLITYHLSAQIKNDISGEINIDKKDEFITLRAIVENESLLFKDQLTYIFIAVKKEENGNYSNSKQTGAFSLKPQEESEQAIIRINLSDNEELRTYLFVKQKDKLISKDSIFINIKTAQKVTIQKEQDFVLKGIVVDEAFSKIGRDFHDFFYQQYLLSGKKYPFIIKIKEKPGMARSSILSVEIEDYKIHEFFSRPDEEYLKANVKLVLERISAYEKRRQTIYKNNK
ncbi:CsgE family curli-type amyloid fiber assembly protein [Polaribacter sp. IC073]|uniref:CsgE family curli-type amyloid fiber assembly protein n=1 Tax=Polaribacter sp. IC073 TaxID=2508540 RepID=UPI0011BF0151|nr:CsgE family curli-type amyloid fiber assembly protein [Polaribacter sp. IC073]TXD45979.1 hypothetical protein ES045_15415 [Polaribacter sp. IC073]